MNNVITPISRRIAVVLVALLCWGALPQEASAKAQPPSSQQSEFKSLDQLPPAEQVPAATLLVAAYAFVLVGLFLYVVTVARRLTTVQREIERLESDVKRAGRS